MDADRLAHIRRFVHQNLSVPPYHVGDLLAERDALAAEAAAKDERVARLLATLREQTDAKVAAQDRLATATATIKRLTAALDAIAGYEPTDDYLARRKVDPDAEFIDYKTWAVSFADAALAGEAS